jgi:hypothetical protein
MKAHWFACQMPRAGLLVGNDPLEISACETVSKGPARRPQLTQQNCCGSLTVEYNAMSRVKPSQRCTREVWCGDTGNVKTRMAGSRIRDCYYPATGAV